MSRRPNGGYLVYAPRLHCLSKERGYITVGDFIQDRYGSALLSGFCSIIFIIALASYILSNLKAIGYVISATTGGRVGFAEGVLALSVLIVIYETLGGLRAVAWTALEDLHRPRVGGANDWQLRKRRIAHDVKTDRFDAA